MSDTLGNSVKSGAHKLKEGQAKFKKKEYQAAEAIFRSLVKDEEYSSQANSGLGLIALIQGKMSKAERLFIEALVQDDTKNAEAHYGLGICTQKRNRAAALGYYEEALRICPQHKDAKSRWESLTSEGVTSSRANKPNSEDVAEAKQNYATLESEILTSRKPRKVRRNGRERLQFIRKDTDPDDLYQGQVSDVKMFQETRKKGAAPLSVVVREFTLHRSGNLRPLTVHMEGVSAEGSIENGDQVIVNALPPENSLLWLNKVLNETRSIDVRISGSTDPEPSEFEKAQTRENFINGRKGIAIVLILIIVFVVILPAIQ